MKKHKYAFAALAAFALTVSSDVRLLRLLVVGGGGDYDVGGRGFFLIMR